MQCVQPNYVLFVSQDPSLTTRRKLGACLVEKLVAPRNALSQSLKGLASDLEVRAPAQDTGPWKPFFVHFTPRSAWPWRPFHQCTISVVFQLVLIVPEASQKSGIA